MSLSLDEPQFATASTVRNWLFLEQPGPWGYDAVADSRLPVDLASTLLSQGRALDLRVLLIRRPGRSDPQGRRCYIAHSGPARWWIERVDLNGVHDVLDLDLSPVPMGLPTGAGEIEEEPLYLVCTNGRRDPCCAERGRPLVAALAQPLGDQLWECSHIGGDRFAANLVCFPHGLYFGRVGAEEAMSVASAYRDGVVDLDHYRGRSCYPFAVQAAEFLVRRRLDLRGVDDLRWVGARREGADVTSAFDVLAGRRAGTRTRVRVHVGRAEPPRRLTCHAERTDARPPTYAAVEEG